MIAALVLAAAPLLQEPIEDPAEFNGFLLLGYFAMWLIVVIYLLSLANRQRNAEAELELMEQLLREEEEGSEV
ncbi:MAG: CcmD family protein [Candidatus Promineifilaceae bacterium]